MTEGGDGWVAPERDPEIPVGATRGEPSRRAPAPAPGPGPILFILVWAMAVLLALATSGDKSEIGHLTNGSLEAALFVLPCVLVYQSRRWRQGLGCAWLSLCALLGFVLLLMCGLGAMSAKHTDPADVLLIFLLGGMVNLVWALWALPGMSRTAARLVNAPYPMSRELLACSLMPVLTTLFMLPQLLLNRVPVLDLLPELMKDLPAAGTMFRGDFYDLLWNVAASFLAVGWGIERNGRQACQRLGLVRLDGRSWLRGLLFGGALFALSSALDPALAWLVRGLGGHIADTGQIEQLFASYTTAMGAVVVGVTAGVGEEILVRGVLQPRVGIVLSSAFFASLHALQYSWDGVLSCFVIGMLLGAIRRRWNTGTAMVVHGFYDFLILGLAALAR